MILKVLNKITLLPFFLVVFALNSTAQLPKSVDQHILVVMRMIGDEVLLSVGDSTSRVLPIEKKENRYRIAFENPFEFYPANLVAVIDGVLQKSDMASRYLVEFEACDTETVIYSYEVGNLETQDYIPCQTRPQPQGCYVLYLTLLHPEGTYANLNLVKFDTKASNDSNTTTSNYLPLLLLVIPLLLIVGWYRVHNAKPNVEPTNPDLVRLGAFQFDRRNMILAMEDDRIELTSKETDLLDLLYSSANKTLERDNILNKVWGDEGDYVGRTLDVFISKLRKKLEADANLKIINIRGVGYKLVINS